MQVFAILLWICYAAAYPSGRSNTSERTNLVKQWSGYLIQTIFGSPPKDPAVFVPTQPRDYPSQVKYNEDIVLRFNISSEEEARSLGTAVNTLFLDVWESNKEWADIRLAKDVTYSLLSLLPFSMRNKHVPLIHDLTNALQEASASSELPNPDQHMLHRGTRQEFSPSLQKRPEEPNVFFNNYQPLSVIVPWMRLMQSLFSTHVRTVEIGKSFEGRSILGLKVGVHPGNSEQSIQSRKTILITGGSHAREWISVSSVTYAAYALITSYGKTKQMTKLIEEFDWVFIPTVNPDGYVKTWEHDRLWRKNTQVTSVRFCQGYDIDRSFAFEWDGEAAKGNPCSGSYAGEMPFQAVESLQLANWVKDQVNNGNVTFTGFLDLHSYSQQILYPYAFSCIQTPPTLENLEELALGLAKTIHRSSGNFYGVTSACEGSVVQNSSRAAWPTVETGGGSALDWMYHEIGTKYAYQIKLPDTGSHGFLLPRKYIVPTGEDIFSAVTFFGNYLLGNKGVESSSDTVSQHDQDMGQVVNLEQTRIDLR